MKSHLEIEAKYDVADAQALPDLVGVGGIKTAEAAAEMVLTATYFDTPEHALSSSGATLRRRTGGQDDGWHLKLSVADGERLEVHRPLGRGQTPPAALTSVVRAFAGSNEIAAVATLTTRRTVHRLLDGEGRALAELADDTVTGERLDQDLPDVRWREVEIELLEGDRDLMAALGAAMRAAGVAPAGSASKVGRVLQTPAAVEPPGAAATGRKVPAGVVLDGGLRYAAHALLTSDPLLRLDRQGAPERMRTAVHQLRAALIVRRQVAAEELTESLRGELAWLDTTIARLDDVERSHRRIRAALAVEPKELLLGPVSRRTDHELAGARKAALATVRAMLDSDRYLDLMRSVHRLTVSSPLPPVSGRADDVLPGLADRAGHRAQRRLGQLRRAQSDGEQRWQLAGARRATARARYAALLVPGRSIGPASVSAVLTETADVLSEMDLAAQTQTFLRHLGVQARLAGESAFTFGRLHGLEDLRRAELDRRLKGLRKHLKRLRAA